MANQVTMAVVQLVVVLVTNIFHKASQEHLIYLRSYFLSTIWIFHFTFADFLLSQLSVPISTSTTNVHLLKCCYCCNRFLHSVNSKCKMVINCTFWKTCYLQTCLVFSNKTIGNHTEIRSHVLIGMCIVCFLKGTSVFRKTDIDKRGNNTSDK